VGAGRALDRLAAGALAVLAGAVLLQGLAPPTDYDGLLYHLVAPKAFLDAGAIVYLPHNFSANLPAFGEMLFAPGLAGGSDRMPQLLHGLAGALSVALTYLLGRRCFSRQIAFRASVALAATPLIPFLATRAYIDLFTLVFSLVAIFGALVWQSTGRRPWVGLAGVAAGFALSTKYAALSLLLVLGVAFVLAPALARPSATGRWPAVGRGLGAALAFGAAALVASVPWYARQVAVLGNPVWPMYFGGRDWDAVRVEQLTYFVGHYGVGRTLQAWLLLPWHVYWESWRFGHVPESYPPLVAWAAPLALLWPFPPAAPVVWLLGSAAGLCAIWAQGWQDLRFLLPAYPLLALLGTAGLAGALARFRSGDAVVAALVAGLAMIAAGREVVRAADALGVVSGREPEASYLRRRLPDQRAIEVLNAQVPAGSAVLFLGDGQIWYCRPRCLPDPAHDNLLQWFVRPGSAEAALAGLRAAGVSHILLSKRDYWYLEHQDSQERLKRQLAEFYVFKARYLDLIYEDDASEVYRGRW
jgi:hypothetical protein